MQITIKEDGQGNIGGVLGLVLLMAVMIGLLVVPKLAGNQPQPSLSGENEPTEENLQTTTPSVSQEPFEEMTIPYLRERSYNSSLEEREVYQQRNNYTSYLTSYNSDGLKINGLLTIPKGEQPEGGWSGIVFIHGYIPPEEYQTTDSYDEYIDYLADREIVVFKIDLRGHGDSEGVPSGAYYSGDYIIDTLNAYSALGELEFVNEERVGLWGHSMGGNVVFRSMVAKRDIPAVSIWSGAVYTYSDFSEYGISDLSYEPPEEDSQRREERSRLMELHGGFSAGDEFWRQVVPTNYLEGVSGALQINHATDDPVVSIEYSRNLVEVLDKAETDIDYELVEYPAGGHNISGSVFGESMSNTVEFFKENFESSR